MDKLEQILDVHLRTIGASCPHLLKGLHYGPEAVLGAIQTMEMACQAFEKAYRTQPAKSDTAAQMMMLIAALRTQMAQHGLMDERELAAFRKNVLEIQNCADNLRNTLGVNHHHPEVFVNDPALPNEFGSQYCKE